MLLFLKFIYIVSGRLDILTLSQDKIEVRFRSKIVSDMYDSLEGHYSLWY